MDDDDKIQSPPTPASGSPGSPRANGRIRVTVAAPAPAQNSMALALPVQNQQPKGNGGGGGGGGREDVWSEGATAVLIDAWGERYLQLSRGNLKQKHWREVANIVSSREDYVKTPKTDIQCKNRIDTVKKKYKLEKKRIAVGAGPSKWPFFERLDQLIGPTAKITGSTAASGGGGGAAAGTSATNNSQIQKVPLGIPVGIRGVNQSQYQAHHQRQQKPQPPPQLKSQAQSQKIHFRKRPPVDSDSSRESSPVSSDSFPPETYERKRPRVPREINSDAVERKEKGWGSALRELTQAILKFGEAYEQAETSKIQQVVEMEKQRMKFTKDMELQRMQFFMKTQMEISQLKHGKRGGGGGGNASSNHHNSNINDNNNNSHSDSDNLVRLD